MQYNGHEHNTCTMYMYTYIYVHNVHVHVCYMYMYVQSLEQLTGHSRDTFMLVAATSLSLSIVNLSFTAWVKGKYMCSTQHWREGGIYYVHVYLEKFMVGPDKPLVLGQCSFKLVRCGYCSSREYMAVYITS